MFLPIGAVWAGLSSSSAQATELQEALVAGDPERAAEAMAVYIEATRADVHAVVGC